MIITQKQLSYQLRALRMFISSMQTERFHWWSSKDTKMLLQTAQKQ